MGKPTGFMEYQRCENKRRPPLERIRDWEDIYLPVEGEQRLQQGARCMNCGVPFCQAGVIFEGKQLGCPLHNLIPASVPLFASRPVPAVSTTNRSLCMTTSEALSNTPSLMG